MMLTSIARRNLVRLLFSFSALILLMSSGQLPAASTVPGLAYQYYQVSGPGGTLPDFNVSTPVQAGYRLNAEFDSQNPAPNNLNPFEPGRNDNWSVQFTGNVTIPAAGTWTFQTGSDD